MDHSGIHGNSLGDNLRKRASPLKVGYMLYIRPAETGASVGLEERSRQTFKLRHVGSVKNGPVAALKRGRREAYFFLHAHMLQRLSPPVGQGQVDAPAPHIFGSPDI